MQRIPQYFIDAAIASAKKYSIPASVTIAQACLETGFGEHMPPNSNNCFGIKAKGNEPSVNVKTHEFNNNGQELDVYARFKKFESIEDCFDQHGYLLAFGKPYAAARAYLVTKGAVGFANALTGVYATDPQYGQKLIMIMQHFDLEQYDKQKQPKPSVSAEKAAAVATVGTLSAGAISAIPQHMHIAYSFDVNLIIACIASGIFGILLTLLVSAIVYFHDNHKPKVIIEPEPLDFGNQEELWNMIKQYMQPLIDQVTKLKADSDALAASQAGHSDTQTQLDAANATIQQQNATIAQMKQDDADTNAALAQAAGVDPATIAAPQ